MEWAAIFTPSGGVAVGGQLTTDDPAKHDDLVFMGNDGRVYSPAHLGQGTLGILVDPGPELPFVVIQLREKARALGIHVTLTLRGTASR